MGTLWWGISTDERQEMLLLVGIWLSLGYVVLVLFYNIIVSAFIFIFNVFIKKKYV